MNALNQIRKRLRKILSGVHEETAASALIPELDAAWETSVMRRIRLLSAEDIERSLFFMVSEWTWRLSPVSAAVIIILALFLNRMGLNSDMEMTLALADAPLGFSLGQAFGM